MRAPNRDSVNSMRPRRLAAAALPLVLAVALMLPSAAFAQATPTADNLLGRAVAALLVAQTADGAFLGFSGDPDAGVTTDAVVALRAAEVRGIDAAAPLTRAADWLAANGSAYAAEGPGQAAKMTLAAVAAGRDPHDFSGVDPIALMTEPPAGTPAPAPDLLGDDLYDHALAVLALAAAGEPVPPAALDALRQHQSADGGWAFTGATDPGAADSNTTALVIQALVAAGADDEPAVTTGMAALHAFQTPDGAFAYQPSDPPAPDANSTALAIQAIIAAGGDPASAEWSNAAAALETFANPDGNFFYTAEDDSDNLFATLQAIPALAGLPAPVAMNCTAAPAQPAPVGLAALRCLEPAA